jgi:hypothetical protein
MTVTLHAGDLSAVSRRSQFAQHWSVKGMLVALPLTILSGSAMEAFSSGVEMLCPIAPTACRPACRWFSRNAYCVQVITMPDTRYKQYCNSSDFIREHIFPGGHLPSMGAMSACAGAAGLAAVGLSDIGPHYAITLREWRKNWNRNWDAIQQLGYTHTFMRKCVPHIIILSISFCGPMELLHISC